MSDATRHSPLFSPMNGTSATSHQRDTLVQIQGASLLSPDQLIDHNGSSEWHFMLDVSDQEKRRVQEMFRSGNGSRSTTVFPPSEAKDESNSNRRPTITLRGDASSVLSSSISLASERRPTTSKSLAPPGSQGLVRSPSPQFEDRRGSDSSVSSISAVGSGGPRRPSFIPPPLRKKATTILSGPPVAEPSFGGGVVVSFSGDLLIHRMLSPLYYSQWKN